VGLRVFIPLTLVLALVAATPAAADLYQKKKSVDAQIAELQGKVAQTHEQENALKGEIASVSTEIRSLERQVGDVSLRLAPLEHELVLRELKLNRLNALFQVQTQRLEFLRREYAVALARLNARLVAIYEGGETDPLAVVLSVSRFSDFLDAIDYIRQIGDEDKRITDEVAMAKTEVKAARERTTAMRKVVAQEARVVAVRVEQVRQLRDELIAHHAALAATRAKKRQSLASLTANERAEASEMDALAAVSNQLAEKIRAAEAAAAAARAAAEAKALAEAQAQAQASSGSDQPAPPPPPAASPGTPSSSGLIWPVNGPVTSPFGWRWGRMHEGIDIGVPYGTPIMAAASGTVIYAGWMDGYGNLVVIDHGNGLATAYAHQSQIAVSLGQSVAQGQVIGYVGCTGHCFGPHLHFEVRINGSAVDPLGYL
jgi:murein DD-endopeptidase MepM/ murein hydrolase activator NlpD